MKELLVAQRKRKIMTKLAQQVINNSPSQLAKHVLCSNGSWIDGNSVVPK